MTVLLPIFVVSSIAAALAAVLVVARKVVADYGECEVTINDDEILIVEGGVPLLENLVSKKLFIPSACGGRGTCGYCKLKVLEGGGPVLPTEEPFLDKAEQADNIRLSCQVKVRENMRIEIPQELLSLKEYRCRCEKIVDLTHDVREIRLKLLDPTSIAFKAGQYLQLSCPSYSGNEEVYRAYSIASDQTDNDSVEFVIRLVPGGICTTWCFDHLEEGDELKVNGPYGDFVLSDTDAPMIMIAGGSGMAPMRSILHQLKNAGSTREAIFFFGANRVDELFYIEMMKDFEGALPGFKFVPVVATPEDGVVWEGETGLVTEAVQRHVKDASAYEGYLCGSPGMINASKSVLTAMGVAESKIYHDEFS
jgi:Na+-transporting NADH:ubiquinone oxidoreductase subunit F